MSCCCVSLDPTGFEINKFLATFVHNTHDSPLLWQMRHPMVRPANAKTLLSGNLCPRDSTVTLSPHFVL